MDLSSKNKIGKASPLKCKQMLTTTQNDEITKSKFRNKIKTVSQFALSL